MVGGVLPRKDQPVVKFTRESIFEDTIFGRRTRNGHDKLWHVVMLEWEELEELAQKQMKLGHGTVGSGHRLKLSLAKMAGVKR
jgi:hypothetical protein